MIEKAKDAELADRLEAVLGSLSWCIHRHSQSEDAGRWIRHRKVVEGDLVTIRHAIAVLADRDAENERLRELLAEVAASGVEMDDPRIGYVVVQIDRKTWQDLSALNQGEG